MKTRHKVVLWVLAVLGGLFLLGILLPENPERQVAGKPEMSVSFTVLFTTAKGGGVAAAYTDDPDSLWLKKEWVDRVKARMERLSHKYDTVLLFDAKDHTPDVARFGMEYPQHYDRWMVAGFWKYPTGAAKFCYGGSDPNGNLRHCMEMR